MGAPSTVTKVLVKKGKTEIRFEDGLDQTQYFIHELNRAALRDVGKFIKKVFRTEYYKNFKRRTGEAPKAVYAKVWASASTTAPRLEIGLPHSHRGKEVTGFYSFFQEFGSSKTPRLGILQNAVKDNVAEIIKIESQYLTALEGEASRLDSLIDESDMEVDDE